MMADYTDLAIFMTERHHPILRKYQHMALRDLLYMQAELCELETKHEAIAIDDKQQSDERRYYGQDWSCLEASYRNGFGGEQWDVALEIRRKLQIYCE